jgi:hypothetical protein
MRAEAATRGDEYCTCRRQPRKARLTRLYSCAWNEMAATRAPGASTPGMACSSRDSEPSSSFTAMRRACAAQRTHNTPGKMQHERISTCRHTGHQSMPTETRLEGECGRAAARAAPAELGRVAAEAHVLQVSRGAERVGGASLLDALGNPTRANSNRWSPGRTETAFKARRPTAWSSARRQSGTADRRARPAPACQ